MFQTNLAGMLKAEYIVYLWKKSDAYRILHELSFNINLYETRNELKAHFIKKWTSFIKA